MHVEVFKYYVEGFVYVSLKTVKSHSIKQPCILSPVSRTQVTLGTLSRSGRISQEGDITPSEELWCTVPQVED